MQHSTLTRNFIYNVIGALSPIVISLISVPLYLNLIGLERYGVVTLCWVLLGYFGFLDFGMSRAAANAMARIDVHNERHRSQVLMTTIYTNIGFGAAGGALLWALGSTILSHSVQMTGSLIDETVQSFPWMAAMLPCGMLNGVLIGALESREKFFVTNFLSIAANTAGQLFPLLAAYIIGPHLTVVIPAMLFVRVIYILFAFILVLRTENNVRVFDYSIEWLRRLFGYGSWVSVSSFLNPILDSLTQLVVGATLGAAAVASYAVPMTLATRSLTLATSLARALFPRMSKSESSQAIVTGRNATRTLACGFAIVCGPVILLCQTFLHFWIGEKFADTSGVVAQILMFGAWANGVALMPYTFLQAQGRPDITAKVSLVEILPFLLILWFAIEYFGIEGAAFAWTIRVTLNCVALLYISKFFDKSIRGLLLVALLMLLVLIVTIVVPMSHTSAIISAFFAFLSFLICALLLDASIRQLARSTLFRIVEVRKSGS